MYVCITHVDAATGIPCTVEPMRRGPAFPKVKGLQIKWFNQSDWPTDKPLFYGTCDDDADTSIRGVLSVLTEAEYKRFQDEETGKLLAKARNNRAEAYAAEADPLFFKHQRGEGSEQDWLKKIEEIRERFPYPTED
jgi:hypothetical protein